MTDLTASIDQFIDFFRGRMAEIAQAQIGFGTTQFRKTLYVSLLDSLSKTVSNPNQNNRERFTALMAHFAAWPNGERISLPHLVRLLEKLRSPEFSRLRSYALDRLDGWPKSNLIDLDRDLPLDDVRKLWPSSLPKPVDSLRLDNIQHLGLFYSHRNFLVHEFRQPGRGLEFRPTGDPYYHSLEDTDSGKTTWELVYPVGFYHKVCEAVLENLRPYYYRDRIDPYECFTFGTYWIEELNQ